MWKRCLALVHPDAGGDTEAFQFLSSLRDHLDDAKDEPAVKQRPVTISYTIFGIHVTYH